jgi:hypothetical protein
MPGVLYHTPAEVTRRLLIARGLGADPPATPWPIFTFNEPNRPDNLITIYDVAGRGNGWLHTPGFYEGESEEYWGIQLRIRSARDDDGWLKGKLIADAMDKDIHMESVTFEGHTYCVHSYNRTTPTIPIGKEEAATKRALFTLNALVSLRNFS